MNLLRAYTSKLANIGTVLQIKTKKNGYTKIEIPKKK